MFTKTCTSLIVFLLVGVSLVKAEKLDLESQTILINKIESTLHKINPSDKSIDQLGLKAQLANLYSEQARLLIIEEGKLNCEGCQGSSKLRLKSIRLYKEVIPYVDGDFKAGMALQLAHLYELTNQLTAAIAIYNEVILNVKHDTASSYIGKAYVNRGNNYFRQGQFIPAQKDFKQALTLIRSEEKGSVLHKIAWTYYNQGEIAIAISQMKSLLSQTKYLEQASSQGNQYNESLHSELAHDLALFMAKSDLNIESIKQLVKLTPKSSTIDNLLFLGDECDRLDAPSSAIMVWQFALVMPDFPQEKKPIVRVKTAKYFREKMQFENALKEFKLSLQDQLLCKSDTACSEYLPLAKNYLTSWDKAIKSRSAKVNLASAEALLLSYQYYNNQYHSDVQTLVWQAQLARDIGKRQLAMETYHKAADEAIDQKITRLAEESLLAEIDLAEKINSAPVKIKAYNHYISLLPQGKQIWIVKFALANSYYDLKKFQDAADIYTLVAHQCDCKTSKDSIALKSAHLELDSLAKIDQPEKIEVAAKDYAVVYPKDRIVFYKIARNAGLKLAFRMANSKDTTQILNAIKKLDNIPMLGANKEEKNSYYKLKMQLDELVLNFDSAYNIALALGMDKSNNSVDLIKVLMLAELSNHNSTKIVDKVISMKVPVSEKQIAFVIKIRKASNPWILIDKYSSVLRSNSEMFADLLIETFSRTKNFSAVERYTKDDSVIRTANGATLWRLVFLKKIGLDAHNIQAAQIRSSTDKLLASTFNNRLYLLKEIQKKVKKADGMKDWSAQVISRSIFKTENVRLANDIQKLPIPRGLKKNEVVQYRKGLESQSRPFVNEAILVSQQMEELWKNTDAVNGLVEDIKNQLEYHMIYVSEANAVSTYAPENIKAILAQAMSNVSEVPSAQQVNSVRQEVSKNPYDDQALQNLISIEKIVGNKIMVAYLESRRRFSSQLGVVKK